mgnify:CR=1 FL=1
MANKRTSVDFRDWHEQQKKRKKKRIMDYRPGRDGPVKIESIKPYDPSKPGKIRPLKR